MMRFFASVALFSLATVSLAAQRDRTQPTTDPVTIRGCLHEHLELWANAPIHQAFDSYNWVAGGQRFRLVGDTDLIEELWYHERHEMEITGLFQMFDSPPIVAQPPQQPGGRQPGFPSDPFARPATGGGVRVRSYPSRDEVADLVVTAYEHVSLNCRQ